MSSDKSKNKDLFQIDKIWLTETDCEYFVNVKKGTTWVNLSSFKDVEEAKLYMSKAYKESRIENKQTNNQSNEEQHNEKETNKIQEK